MERNEESDITLTIILTKNQHGEKPEICVMDKTSPAMRGQHIPGPRTSIQYKKRAQSLSQSKQIPATQTVTQATKTSSLRHDYKAKPPAGELVASGGHIRIVSRLSLPRAKSNSAPERSFLIKSSRNEGSQQPLNMRKDQLERSSRKTSCSTRHSLAAPMTSSTTVVHKKMSTGPVSAPKMRPHSLDSSSKAISNSQNTYPLNKPIAPLNKPIAPLNKPIAPLNKPIAPLNKPIAPRRSAGPPGGNKTVERSKYKCNEQNRRSKQQDVSGATKENTKKPSNVAARDTTSRPQTPRMTAEDRKKKLQEWINSKGKTYKRPPMILPPKRPQTAKKQNPCNQSLWEGIEEEEELLALSKKICQILSECLELIEKGISGEDIHAALDNIPEAKKFAKYWVCKARLLEREGIYDVIDLYKQGVQFGATPIDELRDVVFDIMKNTNKKTKVVTFGPLPAEEMMENEHHEDIPLPPFTKCTEEVKTPCTGTAMCDQGSAVKLQVTSLSSKKIPGSGQEWKRLTPVRRSVRIHHSSSQYPEVVQEHDTVVSSLEELLDMADTEAYLYMRNEALPSEADHVIGSMTKDPIEGQKEGPP